MPTMLILNEVGCTCKKCVESCKTYACLPTPQEAEALIAAGYGDRMMLDTRPSDSEPKIRILTLLPAMKGFERRISPMQLGASDCVFLKNERCILHDLGLKPFEGRFQQHDTPAAVGDELLCFLKGLWDTRDGQRVVDMWIEKYLHPDCR